jgi:hypothetical protein
VIPRERKHHLKVPAEFDGRFGGHLIGAVGNGRHESALDAALCEAVRSAGQQGLAGIFYLSQQRADSRRQCLAVVRPKHIRAVTGNAHAQRELGARRRCERLMPGEIAFAAH